MIGAKKLTRNTWLQVSMSVSIVPSREPPFALRRNRGVVDQRMQRAALEPLADFADRARGVGVIGKIDLDVILGAGVPWAIFRERMPRAGEDAPAGGREADHGGMPDAAAGAGQKQRASWRVGRKMVGMSVSQAARRHGMTSRVLVQACAARLSRREFDAVVQAERAVVPELEAQRARCASRSSPAVAAPRRSRISPRPWRSPARRQNGFPAAATACWPRRRSAPASGAWRNRRRPPQRSPATRCRGCGPAGAATSSEKVTRP